MKRTSKVLILLLLCCLHLTGSSFYAWSQVPGFARKMLADNTEDSERATSSTRLPDEKSEEEVDIDVVAVQKKLADAQALLEKLSSSRGNEARAELLESARDLLEVYRAQLVAQQRLEDVRERREQSNERLETMSNMGLGSGQDTSISNLDDYKQDKKMIAQRMKALTLTLEVGDQNLEQLKEKQLKLEKNLRKLNAGEAFLTDDRNRQLVGIAEYKKELNLVIEQIKVAKIEQRASTLELKTQEQSLEVYEGTIAYIEKNLSFHKEDLQEKLDNLDNLRRQWEKAMEEAQGHYENASQKLDQAQKKPLESQTLKEQAYVKLLEAWRDTYDLRVSSLENLSQTIDLQKQIWNWRYELLHSDLPPKTLKQHRDELKSFSARAEGMLMILDSHKRTLLLEGQDLADIKEGEENFLDKETSAEIYQTIAIRSHYIEQAHRRWQEADSLADRALDEVNRISQQVSIWERVKSWLSYTKGIGNIEVFSIDDRSVTLSKIFFALCLFIFGLWFVRTALRRFTHKALRRLHVSESVVFNLESIIHYFSVVMLVLLTLKVVNIPLTVFTVLGGTFAIAVGLGAQNILNNFISGLILMVERPIKVKDLIEVAGVVGVVEEIGARSTRVRTGQGVHVIVPNSQFLDGQVTNWTLHDDHYRAKIEVGVDYESDLDLVVKLLTEAAIEHPEVKNAPDPIVLFKAHADSTLNFELHFWVEMKSLINLFMIESDLRHSFTKKARKAGVSMAFPQRDLRLYQEHGPIQLEMVDPKERNVKERDTKD